MALSLKNIVQRVESIYGKLGDAQHREIETLFMEDDDFARQSPELIWKTVNQNLCDKKYVPLTERMSEMEKLFPAGDEYPDIYRGSLSEVDMDDLL